MTKRFEKSDPFVRQALVAGITAAGGSVKGVSLRHIGDQLGLRDISASQLIAAAGSLCYKRRLIAWSRFWPLDESAQYRYHELSILKD